MAVNAMKNGAIDFVAKPIDPEKFIAAITRTIEKQHLRNLGIASEGELRARYALLTKRNLPFPRSRLTESRNGSKIKH